MHDLETIVAMNKEAQEKSDEKVKGKEARKEEKINQLRNAISRIMGDFTLDIGTLEDMQSVLVIPERSFDSVKELILHEVKIRFPVKGE